jgi:hypothetical protein
LTTEQQITRKKCIDNDDNGNYKYKCLQYSEINAAPKEAYLWKDVNASFNLQGETITRPRPSSFFIDERNITHKKQELEHLLKQFSLK